MTRLRFRALAHTLTAMALVALVASPASARDKEHQQLAADLRMLQEQTQQLHNLLNVLTDAIKAVNTRIDEQSAATRKAFADEKLLIDNVGNDLRVVREKVDDNNVRIGSISQEVDALRQLVQQAVTRPAVTTEIDPSAVPPGTTPAGAPGTTATAGNVAPPPPPAPLAPVGSPSKAFDQARGDYAAGLYDLAIDGFEAFLRDFPKATQADNAQFLIGRAYLNDAKNDKAVEAFDKVIRMYPTSDSVSDSYYLKGLALRNLRQPDRAREAFETVVKNYPDSPAAALAKQALAAPRN